MNLDDKIKEILEEVWNDNMSYESEGVRETIIKAHKQLKQLFIKELKACLPERKKPHTYSSENSEEYIKYCDAYNQALNEAEQNINKKYE